MALIYQAELTPSKIDLLAAWIPTRPWLGDADVSTLEAVGAYRFDDPAGEVGIETHLLRSADGQVLHVPLTYRGAPLTGAEAALVGTMQHSVLGPRWVYDGCADAVYATALASAVLTGGTQADLEVATASGPERREPTTRVSGSGTPGTAVPALAHVTCADDGRTTVITAGPVQLVVLRAIGAPEAPGGEQTLVGTWPGHDTPELLAVARTT